MIAEPMSNRATNIMSKRGQFKTVLIQNFLYRYDFKDQTYQRFDLTKLLLTKFPVSSDCQNGCVLISGGLDELDQPLPTSVLFDSHKDKMFVVGDMIQPRYRHALVVCGSKAYAFGGLSTGRRILKSAEVYDFTTETWAAVSSMQRERADMTAVCHDKSRNIFVFGGCLDKDFNNIIEKYDTVMNVWVTLTLSIQIDFERARDFVCLQPSIILGGGQSAQLSDTEKESRKKIVKYKSGLLSTGERLLFFKEDRYTDNLEVLGFSLNDGEMTEIYSKPALVKGNVSSVILQTDKEETTMVIFKEFNERDVEVITGSLETDLNKGTTGKLTFEFKEQELF